MPQPAPSARLTGTLATMPLADLLQWLAQGGKTGTLHLERGMVEKQIFFDKGRLISASSNIPRETLGQILLQHGRIGERELREALAEQQRSGQPLGRVLVEQGHLGQEELTRVLQMQAEEAIFDLFQWDEGSFRFDDGLLPSRPLIPIGLDVTGLAMEGVRRRDELALFRQTFPTDHLLLRIPAQRAADAARLTGFDRRLADLIGQRRTIAEIALESRAPEFVLLRRLHELHEQGLVEVEGVGRGPQQPATGASVRELLAGCRQALERADPEGAVRFLRQAGSAAEMPGEARLEIEELEKRVALLVYSRLVPPDAVPLLARPLEELTTLPLGPAEGFILSRITGTADVRSIVQISPMKELEALLIFQRLRDAGIIRLRPAG